jgi:hypothetical protein
MACVQAQDLKPDVLNMDSQSFDRDIQSRRKTDTILTLVAAEFLYKISPNKTYFMYRMQCQARVETISHNYGYSSIWSGSEREAFHFTKMVDALHTIMGHWRNENRRGKTKILGKNCASATVFTTYHTQTGLGYSPGLCSQEANN